MRIIVFILLITSKFVLGQSFLETDYQLGLLNTSINAQHLIDGNGFLNDDFKNQLISDLDKENSIFLYQEVGTKYTSSKGWTVGLESNIIGQLTYPKDLVKLILYGNGQLLGEEISLDPVSIEVVHYSKLFYGFKVNKNLDLRLGFITGHQIAKLDVNKGIFETEELGASINYDVSLEAQYSDTIDPKIFSVNGIGFSFGADYTKEIENGSLDLSLSDMGLIRWDNNTSNLSVESQYSFNGVEITDFNNFNDSLLNNELDKIEEDFQANTIKNYYHYRLPFRLNAKLSQLLNNNLVNEVTFMADYINNFYPTPRWSLQLHKDLKRHRISLGYHVGGVEHPGLEFSYKYNGDKNQIRIFTKQANYFKAENIYGFHFGLSVRKILKSKEEKRNEK